MDAAAVNIANANSVGFRRAVPVMRGFQLVFAEEVGRSPGHTFTGVQGGGADLEATYVDEQQGPIRPTGRPLDVALDGPGFFVLETPAGLRYTRAGTFSLNSQSELVSADGHLVLGQGGPIVVDGNQVDVGDDGSVRVDGTAVDRLLLVTFPDAQRLIRVGQTQYMAPPDIAALQTDATGTTVHGHHVEDANLNVVEELAHMIEIQRTFELATRAVRVVDRTLGVAVQDIASPG